MIKTNRRELNKQLKQKDAEISRLRRALASKDGEKNDRLRASDTARALEGSGGYFDFVRKTIKNSSGGTKMGKMLAALKKYAAVSRALKIITRAISFLRTGASLLLVAGVLAVLLPAAAIFFGASLFVGSITLLLLKKRVKNVRGAVFFLAYTERTRIRIATERELLHLGTPIRIVPFSRARYGGDKIMTVGIFHFFAVKKALEKNGADIYFIE